MKKISLYFLFLFGCVASGNSQKADFKAPPASYKHDANTIHPEFSVFHVTDEITELHYKISAKELLYTRPDGINFSSNVLISYRLFTNFDSKDVIDSASVRVVDVNNDDADKFLIGKMDVHAQKPRSYYLRVNITDLNRNISVNHGMELDKIDDLNRQNFLVKIKAEDAPLFHSYFKLNQELTINYKVKMAVTVFVRYYKREFPLAAPPFSVAEPKPFQYKADSLFTLQLDNSGQTSFVTNKKGFYHFQLDTTKRTGLTLFNYSETFPDIKTAPDLVPALRFITSKQEFEEIKTSANPKAAVEKFWMNCTGNQDRAKEIIRKYYNRERDANLLFSSYLEGWKTDRGMIFLIYGAPNVIYRTAYAETWTYGEENNLNSLSYQFTKVDNPFSDNDFILDRSAVYKQNWEIAVDIWRQGRTYLQD